MKKYYLKDEIKKHYKIVGILSVVVSIIILVLMFNKIWPINTIYKIAYIFMVIGLPILFITRSTRTELYIDDKEIYFNDGMLSRTRIPLNDIISIEYHPDLKFRFHLRNKKKVPSIPNVFSTDDQNEILAEIKRKRHRIKVMYLEKPEKLIIKKVE